MVQYKLHPWISVYKSLVNCIKIITFHQRIPGIGMLNFRIYRLMIERDLVIGEMTVDCVQQYIHHGKSVADKYFPTSHFIAWTDIRDVF